MAQAFEVTKHDWGLKTCWKLAQLFGQNGVEVVQVGPVHPRVVRCGLNSSQARSLTSLPAPRVGSSTSCDSSSHAVEPTPERTVHPDRARLSNEHEKRRLKCVIRLVRVGQNAPADPQHHRAVPLNQRSESQVCNGVAGGNESVQELPVREAVARPCREKRVHLSQNGCGALSGHPAFPLEPCHLPLLCTREDGPFQLFGEWSRTFIERRLSTPRQWVYT